MVRKVDCDMSDLERCPTGRKLVHVFISRLAAVPLLVTECRVRLLVVQTCWIWVRSCGVVLGWTLMGQDS